jgi:hypothetical protein
MHKFKLLLLLTLIVGTASAQTMKEDAMLAEQPEGSKGIQLKAGTAVKMRKRQGFWVEIDAGGKVGWVKLGQLNLAAANAGPIALETGRTGTGNIVSTSAARGLSAKDLLEGKPDLLGLAKLEALTIETSALEAFRTEGSIVPLTEKIALAFPAPVAKPEKAKTVQSDDDFDEAPKKSKKGGDDW